MRSTQWTLSLILAACLGCGSEVQVNLVINDPCSHPVLGDTRLALEYIHVQVTAPDLVEPAEAIWSRSDGQGELPELEPVEGAVLSVSGRTADGAGNPGVVVAAGAVGRLDLTGAGTDDNLVEINLIIGKVGTFYNTTDALAATHGAAECTTLLAGRQDHTASLLPDGRVLVVGGRDVQPVVTTIRNDTEYYNPSTGLFTRGPTLSLPRHSHTATPLADGKIFIAGGVGVIGTGDAAAEQALKAALLYDPSTGKFADIFMVEQRAHHTATLLGDGRVLVVGGTRTPTTGELATTEVFDPVTRATCPGPTLSTPRAYHAAALVGSSLVAVIGGIGSGQVISRVELVQVEGCGGGSVVSGPSLTVPRIAPMAAAVSGENAVLVAGGYATVARDQGLAAVEMIQVTPLNPAQSTVACASLQLTAPRGGGTLVSLPGGYLVLGGVAGSGQTLATAEIIRVASAATCAVTFEPIEASMSRARLGAVATELLGGDILITGGSGTGGAVAEGEIFVRPR